MHIILASTSPRRRDILALLGVPFEVRAPDFTETTRKELTPQAEALELALGKARSIAAGRPDALVVGGDTLIALGEEKIGKPEDADDAAAILRRLSGRTHRVLTGVAVINGATGAEFTHVECVEVRVRRCTGAEIADYVARGESMDKAGAYSIQGEGHRLIEGIRGDYLAAVGLPLRPVAGYLGDVGVEVPVDVERLYRERSLWTWSQVPVTGASDARSPSPPTAPPPPRSGTACCRARGT